MDFTGIDFYRRVSKLELQECDGVVAVHRNDELVLYRVIAHRRGAGNTSRNDFGFVTGSNLGDAPEFNTANVFGPVFEDYNAIATALGRVLDANHFASWAVCDDRGTAYVDDYNITFSVHRYSIGEGDLATFSKYS